MSRGIGEPTSILRSVRNEVNSMQVNDAPVTKLSHWSVLQNLATSVGQTHVRDLFAADSERIDHFLFSHQAFDVDLSRQRITPEVLTNLVELAREAGVESARDAMFSGEPINNTENRPVAHFALRGPTDNLTNVSSVPKVERVALVLAQMRDLARKVRSGTWVGHSGERIRHVVNIGIGGSDLGPVMAYEALKHFTHPDLDFHFVSNADATDIAEVITRIDPLQTLFIVVSKSFSTVETLLNANTAKELVLDAADRDQSAIAKHFVAVSSNTAAASDFGIAPENIFEMWDWVGGRYSIGSAVGLSTMIAIGPENFDGFLNGFRSMDDHFVTEPLESNLPVLLGLIGLWNRSLLNIPTVAVLPYDQYLTRFPAYLQQLTMESNGKSVTRSGADVEVETGAIYWGEPGTNGQHSFYQLLHQGTSTVAIDLLVTARSQNPIGSHHKTLVSNALAQASIFAFGQSEQELIADKVSPELIPHKVMPGNRPTTLFLIPELTPFALGSLVALYEHLVFVQGVLWGINSFDQWGVELGKGIASSIESLLGDEDVSPNFDQATNFAIEWIRATSAD